MTYSHTIEDRNRHWLALILAATICVGVTVRTMAQDVIAHGPLSDEAMTLASVEPSRLIRNDVYDIEPGEMLMANNTPPVEVRGSSSGGGHTTSILADVYSIFQNPKKYTWGEWVTVAATAVGGYFAYDALTSDSGSSKKNQNQVGLTPQELPDGSRSGSALQQQFVATDSHCGAVTSPHSDTTVTFTTGGPNGETHCSIHNSAHDDED